MNKLLSASQLIALQLVAIANNDAKAVWDSNGQCLESHLKGGLCEQNGGVVYD